MAAERCRRVAAWLLVSAMSARAFVVPGALPRAATVAQVRVAPPMACDDAPADDTDLNLLQTRLYRAVQCENYEEAATYRDRIAAAIGSSGDCLDWRSFGVPEWLCDRLERMGFHMPTRVQVHALEAMNDRGRDAAICAATGSGKTLAYLVPALARLSGDLVQDSLFDAVLAGRTRTQPRGELKVGEDGRLPTDMPTPALVVVVPTRELGVQVSLLAYRLLGGGVNNPTLQPYSNPWKHQPGNKANMFSYKGPRNVLVAGLWDEPMLTAAVDQDLLKRVHVLVGTPEYLARVAVRGKLGRPTLT